MPDLIDYVWLWHIIAINHQKYMSSQLNLYTYVFVHLYICVFLGYMKWPTLLAL